MTEELEQLLKNLKLRRVLEIYDEQLRAADKDEISYSDFVTRLVRAQWQAKQEGALEWRIRRANLPERWTLETFPSPANQASTANRFAGLRSWSSSPRRKISSWSGKPEEARPDWLVVCC
jgi:DNA replication protein DnaC